MQIVIHDTPTEIKVTSVVLESDSLNPDTMRMFFCPTCRTSLFQYSGHIIMIMPGATEAQLPLIVLCRICKTKYLINSIA